MNGLQWRSSWNQRSEIDRKCSTKWVPRKSYLII